jgi:acyl carrier protein
MTIFSVAAPGWSPSFKTTRGMLGVSRQFLVNPHCLGASPWSPHELRARIVLSITGTMTREEFLPLMDELLELDPGTLKGPELLADLESWDSLSIVSFMGLAKAQCGVTLPAKAIASCRSVDDLFALVSAQ